MAELEARIEPATARLIEEARTRFALATPTPEGWTGQGPPPISAPAAQVAQLVEQRTENPRVGGSNPPLGTIKSKT